MSRKLIVIAVIIFVLILPGCWDNVEIDERAFITGLAFDKYIEGEQAQKKDNKKDTGTLKRYIFTISYPNVAVIAKKEQGDPSYIYSTISSSPSDGKQQINIRNNKNFYVNHAKVVILGQELLKDEKMMRETIDVLQRSVYFNRKVHILATEGKGQEILQTNSGKNMDTALFMEELIEKEQTSPRRPTGTFDNFLISLRENNSGIVPKVTVENKEIKIGGAGVLKNNKLIGWLDEIETRGVNILRDEVGVADFTVELEDLYLVVEEMTSNTKMDVYKDKEDKINIDFKIRMEGVLLQHYLGKSNEPFDNKYIKKINKTVENQVKTELRTVFNKIQKDFKADIFGTKEYLRKHDYDLWQEVKEDWEKIYPEAKMNIDLKMHLRRVGIEG